MEKLGICKAMS